MIKMNFRIFFTLLLIANLLSCSSDLELCEFYLQESYLEANLVHEKLFKNQQIEEAIIEVEQIIEKDSNNYIANNYLGGYKYQLCAEGECSKERLLEVYNLYKKSVDICGNYRIGYFNLIELLSELEYDQELLQYLEIYNARYKKRSNLLTRGGEALFRLGQIEKSMQYLDEAIALDSTNAMAYIFRGKCFNSQDNWDAAKAALDYGLALDSLSLGFHERGYTNKRMGKVEEAIHDYNTAISLYENRYESYVGLGAVEVDKNNIDLACAYFQKAKEIIITNEVVDLWIAEYCTN